MSGSIPLTLPPVALRPVPLRGGDHHEMIFGADLDERRAHERGAAEPGGLPLQRAGQLVVGDHAGLGSLRGHDDQGAVDERVLSDAPHGKRRGASADAISTKGRTTALPGGWPRRHCASRGRGRCRRGDRCRRRSGLSGRGSRRRTPLCSRRRWRHAPAHQGGDERGAAPEVLPDVLPPQRLVRVDVDRVQVADRTGCVDDVAVHRGSRARARELEGAGRVVGEVPEFLAGREVVDSENVSDLVVPVEQVHLAPADGRPAEPDTQRNRPQDLRPFLRPRAQESCLGGRAVPVRAHVSGPIRGVGRADRDRDEQRGDSCLGVHSYDSSSCQL